LCLQRIKTMVATQTVRYMFVCARTIIERVRRSRVLRRRSSSTTKTAHPRPRQKLQWPIVQRSDVDYKVFHQKSRNSWILYWYPLPKEKN